MCNVHFSVKIEVTKTAGSSAHMKYPIDRQTDTFLECIENVKNYKPVQ
jgi:hypothetical protein